ncbi:MAG TPA: DUF72 domain-containing protein [Nitrospirota bacterium]|nr:DUF72 domain-containing protein [Nitrospirota bacterium]
MNIYVGTSGFAHKEWKGKFYPEKIAPGDMLRYYAGRLNTVEVNNTFYHMPKENVLHAWAEQVPDGFLLAFKAPQVITHIKRLKNVFPEIEYLFKSLTVLGPKQGPILFQFPKTFRPDMPLLEDFLALIPAAVPCAFEFRNPGWFEAGAAELLRKKGFSLCIADTDENPVQELVSTASWGYLRLRRTDYPEADLARWAEWLRATSWKNIFVYFKHEGEAAGANLAMRFQSLLGEQAGRKVKSA